MLLNEFAVEKLRGSDGWKGGWRFGAYGATNTGPTATYCSVSVRLDAQLLVLALAFSRRLFGMGVACAAEPFLTLRCAESCFCR